jgi:glutamine---fructose-6-phosphate transaminase (isomerizing)
MEPPAYPQRMSTIPEPTLREAPPWAMQEMIEAEPGLARTILDDEAQLGPLVAEVRRAAESGGVRVVGCGSSDHAAQIVAALLEEALGRRGLVAARQAFEFAVEPADAALVLGISHEGETAATTAAMRAGRKQGSRVALITANPNGPAAAQADVVVTAPLLDKSWCHTAGIGVAGRLAGASVADVGGLRETAMSLSSVARQISGLGGAGSFVVVGSGRDVALARELALKIEEGVRLPAVARDIETELHGHLVSARPSTALVAVVTDPVATGARATRAAGLLGAATRLGMPTAAILVPEAGAQVPVEVTATRLDVAGGDPWTTLLSAGITLQLLTLALVMHHGQNPDLIGRENADQREAADIAGRSFPLPTSV